MWRYKLFLVIFFLPLLLYTLWQSIKLKDSRYFFQRLALFYNRPVVKDGIWFHAASVGEINAIIPLIKDLRAHHPGTAITVTTNTATSASVVKQHLSDSVTHIYFPLDYRFAIRRLLSWLAPKACFIVETELWPNLYRECVIQRVPVVIINGRISEKTLNAPAWMKTIYAQTLHHVTHIYSRSDIDSGRFKQLGIDGSKISLAGNLKFTTFAEEHVQPIPLDREYVLAASTREEEEKVITQAWLESKPGKKLLVIAPRHPQRLNDILQDLSQFDISIAIRSKNSTITPETTIYIADTIGELKQFMAGADFVIMGGSFVEKGGHNIIETAQLGKAVIFGADMRNFQAEADLFVKKEAAIQCPNKDALLKNIQQLLANPQLAERMGANGLQLIRDAGNLLQDYRKYIEHYLD